MPQTRITHSAQETIELGRQIASKLPQRAVVLLIGNLGAGKTTLAKGILGGLGVAEPEEVTSPTFTLIHEYPAEPSENSRRAYHIDLYRLDTAAEVAGLGLDDLFDQEAIVLLEWAERFPGLLPAERLEIRLSSTEDAHRVEIPDTLAPATGRLNNI